MNKNAQQIDKVKVLVTESWTGGLMSKRIEFHIFAKALDCDLKKKIKKNMEYTQILVHGLGM